MTREPERGPQGGTWISRGEHTFRAVLFDAGNTLIKVRRGVGTVYAEFAERWGVKVDARELEDAFRSVYPELRPGFLAATSAPHGPEQERTWWRNLVEEVFRRADRWRQVEPAFDALFNEIYEFFARPDPWVVFPDVEPCLDGLSRAGVPLAVVSNWDRRLHDVLEGVGLAQRFRFALVSAEFGVEKPHPAIFLEAVRRLDLQPHEVLHVGDLVVDDLEGAVGAGLAGALIDRDRRNLGHPRRISDLRELLTGLDMAAATSS